MRHPATSLGCTSPSYNRKSPACRDAASTSCSVTCPCRLRNRRPRHRRPPGACAMTQSKSASPAMLLRSILSAPAWKSWITTLSPAPPIRMSLPPPPISTSSPSPPSRMSSPPLPDQHVVAGTARERQAQDTAGEPARQSITSSPAPTSITSRSLAASPWSMVTRGGEAEHADHGRRTRHGGHVVAVGAVGRHRVRLTVAGSPPGCPRDRSRPR